MKKSILIIPLFITTLLLIGCSEQAKETKTTHTELTDSPPKLDENLISQADFTILRRGCKYKW